MDRGGRVLVIDDEQAVLDIVGRSLHANGFSADTSLTGEDGIGMAEAEHYDAIILDIGLPGMNGFEVAAELRRRGNTTPILMLTGKTEEEDIVRGLDLGADAYVTKPHSEGELLARLRALIRRGQMETGTTLTFEDLKLDQAEQTLTRGGTPVRLTKIELKLLGSLMKEPGRPVSRETLLQRVWGLDFDPNTGVLEVHMANLRKKLNAAGPPVIETVRGEGYRLRSSTGE